MVPQSQTVPKAPAPAATVDHRAKQRRWPMALSIWTAVAASLILWTGIVWIISLFMSLFD